MKDAVGVFMALGTQWRWTSIGMGGVFRTGIDYGAIGPVVDGLSLKLTPSLFNDIRTLEREALSFWSAH